MPSDAHTKFVQDFFDLGALDWMEHYSGKIPAGMNPDAFARKIHELGLESQFVDSVDLATAPEPYLPAYLIRSAETVQPYRVYFFDRYFLENSRHDDLAGGVVGKASVLFMMLEMGSLNLKPHRF